MLVLSVNVGSSSVRLGAHGGPDENFRLRAALHLGHDGARDPSTTLTQFLAWHGLGRVDAVVHRVVKGPDPMPRARRLDAEDQRRLEALRPSDPLYLRPEVEWIRAAAALPGPPAAFCVPDAGFFAGLPEVATTYALPRALTQELGLRRNGLHGLAHRSMLRAFQAQRPELRGGGRVVSLQLGAGSSAAAIRHGHPLDTSMGFSPLEGLVMATRAGDLDPGVLLHILRSGARDLDGLERMLLHESGLLGLSGLSADVRTLRATGAPAANLALHVYVRRARKYVGGYLALLGGADAVLLGGGVAEHDPDTRAELLGGLEALGLTLDDAANRDGRGRPLRISAPESRIEVWVIAVDEAHEMLLEAAPLLERL